MYPAGFLVLLVEHPTGHRLSENSVCRANIRQYQVPVPYVAVSFPFQEARNLLPVRYPVLSELAFVKYKKNMPDDLMSEVKYQESNP